jgi:hypothetical protein
MKRITPEEIGAVLLYKPSKMKEIYGFLQSLIIQALELKIKNKYLSVPIADYLTKLFLEYIEQTNTRYAHGELVLRNGWLMSAYFNGVMIYEPSEQEIMTKRKNADIFVPVVNIDIEKFDKVVEKYIDKEFDFANIIQKMIVKILKFGAIQSETEIYERLRKYYETEDKISMGELIARFYQDLGYSLTDNPEYFTLDDIAKSPQFKNINMPL